MAWRPKTPWTKLHEELQETNRLLRIVADALGARVPPRPMGPFKPKTHRDVMVMTPQVRMEQQLERLREEAQAVGAPSPSLSEPPPDAA